MQPRELRDFLRLDEPLCCKSLDEDGNGEEEGGGPLTLSRVKALVSMMTPRDFRAAGPNGSPAFVELDMSVEGFGCVFLPSVAPMVPMSAASQDGQVSGGVGSGERVFPPLTGLSFLTWLYVERASDPKVDSHPIRLLTLTRAMPNKTAPNRRHSELPQGDRLENLEIACLTVQISPLDSALLISTQETDTPGADLDRDSGAPDTLARIPLAALREERQWLHLALVLSRSVLKASAVTVYVNGEIAATSKLNYISATPGLPGTAQTPPTAVNATIGTPPGPLRRQSRLLWRLGSTQLVEETLGGDAVATFHSLGPSYAGSAQSPALQWAGGERRGPLVAEERLGWALAASATSTLTLAKLRKLYARQDTKAIARLLGISTSENATPVRLLHNSAGHLGGPARSLGGVLIGYLGMRSFVPWPVGRLVESVGGVGAVLGLVAMAADTQGLYAALKALLCALRHNPALRWHMDKIRGYQTLATLIEEKSPLLNSHVLHLVFSLCGTLDSTSDAPLIPNQQAFEELLCDLQVWRQAPSELQRLLYEHFYEIITENGDCQANLAIVRSSGLLPRLLFRLHSEPGQLRATKDVVFNLLAAILQPPAEPANLLKFGQFIASLLPVSGADGAEKRLPFEIRELQAQLFAGTDESLDEAVYRVYLRNRCLNILLNSVLHTSGAVNAQLCESIARFLGLDWCLALLSPRTHPGTVHAALRLLRALLRQPALLGNFKEGLGNGGWLAEASQVVENRAGTVLGFSVSAHGGSIGATVDLNPEICGCPGFTALAHLLPCHAANPDVYLAVLSLLVGQPAKEMTHVTDLSLDSVWSLVFGLPPTHSVSEAIARIALCPAALQPLLALLRACFDAFDLDPTAAWTRTYPQTVLQFLTFLYHNVGEFTMHCAGEDFVVALVSTLFKDPSSSASQPTSPSDKAAPEHPSRRAVVELVKSVLVDSFTGANGPPERSSAAPLTDVVLELMPEVGTRKEGGALATALLTATMEHVLAADVLLTGQSNAHPQAAQGGQPVDANQLTAHLYYFTSRLVDCLWNGLFVGPPQAVFDFLLKLLSQAKRRSTLPLDPLLHSLNRTVLHMLCKPLDSLQTQLAVLDCLGKVTTHRSVIFSQTNGDGEFLACLAHLLFMLSVRADMEEREGGLGERAAADGQRMAEGKGLVEVAAKRVWEELYLNKKEALEERLRITLLPEINAARALCGEAANREWQAFVDAEMRGPSRDIASIHSQLQSKIQKVTSGLQRLASKKSTSLIGRAASAAVGGGGGGAGSGSSSGAPANLPRSVSAVNGQTLRMWLGVHVSLMAELFRLQETQYVQWHHHVTAFCLSQWRSVERELTRERGLWGPMRGAGALEKEQLDTTEGPCRMRKKMVPNTAQFYVRFPYRPKLDLPENKNLRCKVGISRDSEAYYRRIQSVRPRTMDPRIFDNTLAVTAAADDSSQPATFLFNDMREVSASMLRKASLTAKAQEEGAEEAKGDEDPPSPTRDASEEAASPDKERSESGDPPSESGADRSVSLDQQSTTGSIDQSSLKAGPENPLSAKGPDNQTLLRLLEEGEELVSMFRCARIAGLETMEGLLLFGKEHYYVVDGFTLLKTREIRDLDFLPENLHDPIVPYTATGPLPRLYSTGPRRSCAKFPYDDVREVHKRRYLLQPIALEVFSADGRNHLLAFPKKTRNKVYAKLCSVASRLEEMGVSGQRSSAALEQSGVLASLIGDTSVTQRWVQGHMSNFQYLMHLNTLAGRSYNDLSQYPVFPWVLRDYESEELDLSDPASFRDLSKAMGAQTPDRLAQFLKRYREWDDPSGETPPYMYGTHYSSAMIVVSYLVRLEPFTGQFLQLQGGHFDLADRMFHSIRDCWISASKNNMADVKELIPEFFYLPEFLRNDNNYDLGVKQSGVGLGDVELPPWAKGDAAEFVRLHRAALESDLVSAHLHEWIDLIFGAKQLGPQAVDAQNLFHHLFYEGNVDFEAIHDPLTRNATIGFINNFGQIPSQLFKKPHPAKKIPGADPPRPSAGLPIPLASSDKPAPRLFYQCLDSLKPPQQPLKEIRGSVGEMWQNEKGAVVAVESNKVLIPPAHQRHLSWGYSDRSIRLGSLDSERSVCVAELSDCGEVVCAACPNARTLVTGSTNSVVEVWELAAAASRKAAPELKLRKALYGHTEPITCLAASGPWVWDLAECAFVRQLELGASGSAVSALAINPATGDLAAAASNALHLFSINGSCLAALNTAPNPSQTHKSLILSLAFSHQRDWEPDHVICVGSSDGVVKIFSLEYVQVSEKDAKAPSARLPEEEGETGGLSAANKVVSPGTGHRASLSSLSPLDPVTPELLRQRLLIQQRLHLSSLGSSAEAAGGQGSSTFSSQWGSVDHSPEPLSPLPPDSGFATPLQPHSRSLSTEQERLAERQASTSSSSQGPASSAKSESSKSESSKSELGRAGSTDSFVFVNREGLVGPPKASGKLRAGFRWEAQLIFRSKLSMHTAFERKDNLAPAAVTGLAESRDGRSLLVGDGRGRVWAWTGGEERGGRADHWVQDLARSSCTQCQQKFSVAERKHHCRNCGQIFCAKCSRFESQIRALKISKPVRVCQNCFLRLRAETSQPPQPQPPTGPQGKEKS